MSVYIYHELWELLYFYLCKIYYCSKLSFPLLRAHHIQLMEYNHRKTLVGNLRLIDLSCSYRGMAPWGPSAGYVEKNCVLLVRYNNYNNQEEKIWNCWVSIFEWHTLRCSSSVINIVNWCFSYINIIKPQSKKIFEKDLWSVL